MKVYTVKDLETFERDEHGRLICPSGDYTQIKSFGEECVFGDGCVFGEECVFGDNCSFGRWCSFGMWCSFGSWCVFGDNCSFGERCRFGMWCSFRDNCSFGRWCSFGEACSFGKNSKFENIADKIERILKIDRIGSRNGCTYFYRTLSDIYVRCGCFFGTIAEFENKVKETHKNNPQYLLEYTEAIRYAKLVLSNGGAKGKC